MDKQTTDDRDRQAARRALRIELVAMADDQLRVVELAQRSRRERPTVVPIRVVANVVAHHGRIARNLLALADDDEALGIVDQALREFEAKGGES